MLTVFCAAILCDILVASVCGDIGVGVEHERSGPNADVVTFVGKHHTITFHTETGRIEVFPCARVTQQPKDK